MRLSETLFIQIITGTSRATANEKVTEKRDFIPLSMYPNCFIFTVHVKCFILLN